MLIYIGTVVLTTFYGLLPLSFFVCTCTITIDNILCNTPIEDNLCMHDCNWHVYTIVIDNLSCTITINDFCMHQCYWQYFYALLQFTTFLCTNAFAISYVAKTSSRWLFITTYINITTNLYIVCNLLLTDTVNCRAATAAKNATYDKRMFL